MDAPLYALTLVAALGSGLCAGALYSFSSFVMPALGALAPERGAEAMRSINRYAVTPPFMADFMGTTIVCLATAICGVAALGDDHGPWLLAGSALYLVGVFGVTMIRNVPLNNQLDREDIWTDYLRTWTRWNHLRVTAGTAACAMFIVALAGG